MPFTLIGHARYAAPVEAQFGRVGAVLITAMTLAITYALVRIAIALWLSGA